MAAGDTLKASIKLTFSGVAGANTSQGFRLGLFDFADSTLSPKRVTADGFSNSSQGSGVQGYCLFQNLGTVFSSAAPMDIRKRTTLADSHLLSASGDWTSLATGPGDTNAFPGFANAIQYTLQIALRRTDTNSLVITATWLNNTNGLILSTAVTDAAATNFNFDGIALRPQDAGSSATTITFNEAKVELIPAATPPFINTQPADQSPFVGQGASFYIDASGTDPLSYQWFYNTNTPLVDATNATLLISQVQASDAGAYSVVVSNSAGSVTSQVALLTVNIPDAPSIVTQPLRQTVSVGQNATFSVVADGTQPLSYQWYLNTTNALANATRATLTLTNAQPGDAGQYSVVVTNIAGSVSSSNVALVVSTTPVAPSFETQPASLIVLIGGNALLTAVATGTAPISYQWNKDGVPIAGATSTTLSLTNVQPASSGSYGVLATNPGGTATSDAALLTVTPPVPVPNSAYNLAGFAQATTGGGMIAETDPGYRKAYNAVDLAVALSDKKGIIKVIEIMTNLSLGYNEIEASAKSNSEPFRSGDTPLLHPVLLQTGVSVVDIQKKNGLTIFSANGSTIYHAKLNIKSDSNIIIRNLKFDQLWEWDEATKGQYDKNDWDFMTIGDGGAVSNVWIDHCTFSKSYDGIIDTKAGCSGITISWCHYTGDDGATNTNSWVWQQINALEANKSAYPMYNFLRTRGFSTTNIVTIMQGHDKTHLAGQNDLDSNNATITMTFHHLWLNSVWDRCVPRLRAGNVHDYDIYVDDTSVLAAKRLRNAIAATMSTADQNTLNNTYDFDPPINGAISTESGALLVEKSVYKDCLYPLRNNQTDPSNPEYTGKIEALDTIYHMDNADGSTTDIRGNSADTGSPMGPFQAPVIPFSWNLPGNQLPYSYTTDDPAQLQAIVTDPQYGAGAGILTWNKTNWLLTSYPATAPTIVAQPQSQALPVGQIATFTAVAGGSGPLCYQWYLNTNNALAGATNATLALTNVQAGNAGAYSVVVSNSVGSTSSAFALLTVNLPTTGFQVWQTQQFTSQQLTNLAISGPDATPAGDGVANIVKYALGLQPFVLAPAACHLPVREWCRSALLLAPGNSPRCALPRGSLLRPCQLERGRCHPAERRHDQRAADLGGASHRRPGLQRVLPPRAGTLVSTCGRPVSRRGIGAPEPKRRLATHSECPNFNLPCRKRGVTQRRESGSMCSCVICPTRRLGGVGQVSVGCKHN